MPARSLRPAGLHGRSWFAAWITAIWVALPAAALEPRFDHRDTHGVFAEALVAHDTLARPHAPTESSWRTGVRAGWGWDLTGEGDELIFGAALTVPAPTDTENRVLVSGDARFRAYFGTEELKTFFDVGLYVPVRSRLAAGPLAGIGLQWDFGRSGGVYAATSFATAFGQARIATLAFSAGAQLRFDLP